MGVCVSSKSGTRQIIDEVNENTDFEKFREEIRDNRQEGVFEVKAKLYEYVIVNAKIMRRALISKYLFFTSDGKFFSSVSKHMFSDLLIDGFFNPQTMILSLTTKQQLVENNAYRIRTYEGKLLLNDKECIVRGNVIEDGLKGKSRLENITFEIDFTTKLWQGSYMDSSNKSISALAYIRYKEFFFTGIAIDPRGVFLIKGINSDKVNMTITYIKQSTENSKKPNLKDVMAIEGVENGNKIEGTISNQTLNFQGNIILVNKGNPRKSAAN